MADTTQIRKLRAKTGAGVLDCKRAIDETSDLNEAAEYLRKKGQAEDFSDRTATEGVVGTWRATPAETKAVFAELNSETDFAAKQPEFREFADKTATLAGMRGYLEVNDLESERVPVSFEPIDATFREQEQALSSTLGEKVRVRRIARLENLDGHVGTYVHSNRKVAAAVSLDVGEDADHHQVRAVGSNLAMQVAAMSPAFLSPEEAPEDVVSEMEDTFAEQMREKGKPENIIPRIVEGKIEKWRRENALLTQRYVKNQHGDLKVGEYLDSTEGIEVVDFIRLEVGEGAERESDGKTFAEEVSDQLEGT